MEGVLHGQRRIVYLDIMHKICIKLSESVVK